MENNTLSGEIIGAAIEVHRVLGPGLLESAYELALERELFLRGIDVERQKAVALEYKGKPLGTAFALTCLFSNKLLWKSKPSTAFNPYMKPNC